MTESYTVSATEPPYMGFQTHVPCGARHCPDRGGYKIINYDGAEVNFVPYGTSWIRPKGFGTFRRGEPQNLKYPNANNP